MQEFNLARTNPLKYAEKIEKHMLYINSIRNQQKQKIYYYSNENYPKINLPRGESAFKECIKILRKIKHTTPLSYKSELSIEVPMKSDSLDIKDGMIYSFQNKKLEISKQYTCIGFHYDNCGLNPEISAILQIVDDSNTNVFRRSNILNSKYKYMGISISKLKLNRYYIFLTFAGEVI
jgi:hypothetical protein